MRLLIVLFFTAVLAVIVADQPAAEAVNDLSDYATARGFDASGAPIGRTSNFSVEDTVIYAWVNFTNVYPPVHTVVFDWYTPSGGLYTTRSRTLEDPASKGYASWLWHTASSGVFIKGYDVMQLPGKWRVDVSLDGRLVTRMSFNLTDVERSLTQPSLKFSWPSTTLKVRIDPSGPDYAKQDVRAAISIWNDAQSWFVFNYLGGTGTRYTLIETTESSGDIITVRFNSTSTSKDYLGVAWNNYRYDSSGRFTAVTSTVYLALRSFEGDLLDDLAFTNVAVHELGHSMGLDHTPQAGDIMNPKAGVGYELHYPSTMNLYAVSQLSKGVNALNAPSSYALPASIPYKRASAFAFPTIIFQISGIGDQSQAFKLKIDDVYYTYSQFPLSLIWRPDSTHTVEATSTINGSSGTRYIWKNWSNSGTLTTQSGTYVTPSSSQTVTLSYSTQYQLRTIIPNESIRTITPTLSDGWLDSGTTVRITLNNIWSLQTNQSRSNLVSYTLDGVTTAINRSSTGSVTLPPLTMDKPHLLSVTSTTQYYLKIRSGNNVAYVNPQTGGWYDSGSSAQVTTEYTWNTVTGQNRQNLVSWSLDNDTPQPVSRSGTGTFTTSTIAMNTPHTVSFNAVTQHYLTIDKDEGEVNQQSQWVDKGQSVTVTATTPSKEVSEQSRLLFTQWSGASVSKEPSISILMDNYKVLKAEWKTQLYLKVGANGGTVSGEGWYDRATTAHVEAITPSNEVTSRSRLVFTAWSGDTTTASPSITLTMEAPRSVTANWKTQYYLTIDDPTGIIKGNGWYDGGSRIRLEAKAYEKVTGGKSRLVFKDWSGSISSNDPVTTFQIDGFKVINANWQQQFYLKVNSPLGYPKGEGWYNSGETTKFSVTTPLGFVIQDVFDNWSGDLRLNTPEGSVVMDSPKTVEASWSKDYTQIILIAGGTVGVAAILVIRMMRSKVK